MVLLVACLGLLLVFTAARVSWAYWTAPLSGQGTSLTGTLTPPGDVAATPVPWRGQARISWAPSSSSAAGAPAVGYFLTRVDNSGGDPVPACGTSTAAPTTSTSCTDTGIPDGTYRYVVTASHRTWTASSPPSEPILVQTDTEPPTISATDVSPAPAASGVYPSAPVALTIHAQDSGGSQVDSVSYTIDRGQPTVFPGDTMTVLVSGEGTHLLSYQATDHAGNTSSVVGTSVSIDTAAPAVSVQHAAGQRDPTNTTPVVFRVVFTEPVTGFTAEDVQVSGATGGATATLTGDGAIYAVSVTGMASDGDVTLTIPADAAHDGAGHGNPASTSGADGTVRFDATAPAAPTAPELTPGSDTGSSSSDRITRTRGLSLTGAAEPGATVTVYSDGAPVASGVATGGAYTITTPTLADGTHLLTATATDAAGNTGPASGGTTITIDTTPPAAPSTPDLDNASDSGPSNTDNITLDDTPTFGGTADLDTTVSLLADAVVTASAAATTGNYALTTTVLTDGAHTITAAATDRAGNTSAASGATTITVDTQTPLVALNAATYSAATGQAQLTGTAGTTSGDAASVTVVICKANAFPCTSGNTLASQPATVDRATATWTTTTGDLRNCILFLCTGPGTVYVQATQSDLAGHTGTSPTRQATFP